jgi:hypothetical protein
LRQPLHCCRHNVITTTAALLLLLLLLPHQPLMPLMLLPGTHPQPLLRFKVPKNICMVSPRP